MAGDPVRDALLPCPFCGASEHEHVPLNGWEVVKCDNCGVHGPYGAHDDDAGYEWNRRRALSSPQAEPLSELREAPAFTTKRLLDLLVFAGLIDEDARDQPEGYDRYATMTKVDALAERLSKEVASQPPAPEAPKPTDDQLDAARFRCMLKDPEGARHLLHLLAQGKGDEAAFRSMMDRIIVSRRDAGRPV